jgi:antitoxin (DNA-binding transcriptional repressor) of toxin-antitoxin stability system
MKTYSVHQAKSQLSKLIQKALRGEDVVIERRHIPVVRLSAVTRPKRKLGFLGKSVWISRDFNKPLKEFRDYA